MMLAINLFAGQVLAKPLWQFEAGEKITGTACVTEDAVYVATWLEHLVALDRKTGEERWKVQLDGHIPGGAAFYEGTLYVATYRGKLYAIDPKTGDEKWVFDMNYPRVYATPVVADGVVYIGDRNGTFFAIDAASGKEIARRQSINWVMGSACVDGDIVYVGRMDWWIYAYRAKTLEVLWKYKTRTSVLGTPVVDEKKLYCGGDDGNLYAIDKKTGRQSDRDHWRFQTAGWIHCRPTLCSNSSILFSSFDGAVYCLERGYGRPQWYFRTEGQVSSSVIVDGDRCYFGSRDGFLYCLEVETGKLHWRFDSGSPIVGTPALRDGIVFVSNVGGRVLAIDTKNPPKTTKPMGTPNWAQVPPASQAELLPKLTTSDKTHILFLDLTELEKVEGLEHAVHEGEKIMPDPALVGTAGTWDAVRAKPYGDVHYDPATGQWQMWYSGASAHHHESRIICYATSTDGLRWSKPDLGTVEFMGSKRNNIVVPGYAQSPNVLDVSEVPGAKHHWRLYTGAMGGDICIYESDDCINWQAVTRIPKPHFMDIACILLDRNAANPKQRFKAYGQQYTVEMKLKEYKYDRQLSVMTSEDGLKWDAKPTPIISPGELGVSDSEEHFIGVTNYGNYYIALYDAMYKNHSCDTEMALSRDGIHFKRVLPNRKFIKVGKFGDYDQSMMSICAGFDTTAERHYQYYAASRKNYQEGCDRSGLGQPWRRTTGLRVWRRDGFTSLRVPTGYKSGTLLTKSIEVQQADKNSLVLNLHVPNSGTASVSIIDDATGKPIVGYQKSDPISGIDRINHVVTFGGRSDFSGLAKQKRVRLRISLTGSESQIYSIRFQQK